LEENVFFSVSLSVPGRGGDVDWAKSLVSLRGGNKVPKKEKGRRSEEE